MSLNLYSSATTDSLLAAKLSDAPLDGWTYGRNSGAWSIITGAGLTISDLSNQATSTLNAGVPTAGQSLTYDGTDLIWATIGGGVAWGAITGTLSTQTDLQAELDLKANLAAPSFTSGISVDATGITFSDSTVQTTAAAPYTADNVKADAIASLIIYFPYYGSSVSLNVVSTIPAFISALGGSWGIYEDATSTYYPINFLSGNNAYFSGSWGATGPFYVQVNGTNSLILF